MLTITVLHNIRGDSPLEFDTSTEEGRKQAQEAFNKLLRAGTAIFLTRANGVTLRVTGYDVHTDKLEVRQERKAHEVTAEELDEAVEESIQQDKQRAAEEVPEQLKGEKGEVGDIRQVKTKRPGGRRKVKVTKVDPQSGEIVAVAPVAGGSYFNEDQQSYMRYLGTLEPSQKCYCGWYKLGECPHCPAGKTAADKLADRGSDQASSVCKCNDRPFNPRELEPGEGVSIDDVVAAVKSQQEQPIPDDDTAHAAEWLRKQTMEFDTPMFWLVTGLLANYRKDSLHTLASAFRKSFPELVPYIAEARRGN